MSMAIIQKNHSKQFSKLVSDTSLLKKRQYHLNFWNLHHTLPNSDFRFIVIEQLKIGIDPAALIEPKQKILQPRYISKHIRTEKNKSVRLLLHSDHVIPNTNDL